MVSCNEVEGDRAILDKLTTELLSPPSDNLLEVGMEGFLEDGPGVSVKGGGVVFEYSVSFFSSIEPQLPTREKSIDILNQEFNYKCPKYKGIP